MAEFTITECIARLRRLPEKVAERAAEIMHDEIEATTNGPGIGGHLADTVKIGKYADGSYYVGTNKYTTGPYGIREVGAIIQAGRPELWPRYKKALRWEDPYSGEVIYAGHANAVPYKNNFVERTKKQVEDEIDSGQLSL